MKLIRCFFMILIVTFAQKGNSFGGIDVPKLPGLPGGLGGGGHASGWSIWENEVGEKE